MVANLQAFTVTTDDQTLLLEFSLKSLYVLALDDIWTPAASVGAEGAVRVGSTLGYGLDEVTELLGRVSELMGQLRPELNGIWLQSSVHGTLSGDTAATMNRWIQQYGGLGDAAVAATAWLGDELREERDSLTQRIGVLAAGAEGEGDLRKITKAFIALAVGAALVAVTAAVAGPLVGPVAAAALGAVKDLAVAAFGIAATAATGTVVT